MPLAWDINGSELYIDNPHIDELYRLLARWSDIPDSLVMWSAPTPAGGAKAELVVLREGSPAEVESLDIQGKIVLTPKHPTRIKSIVSQRGGVGQSSERGGTDIQSVQSQERPNETVCDPHGFGDPPYAQQVVYGG